MDDLGTEGEETAERGGSTEFHVDRVRAGDPTAFAQLYERLAPCLDAWSELRVTGTLREYVEPGDIVQEVWWRAMDAFERYDPDRSDFRSWIFKIATNVLLESNRKRRRKARLEAASLGERVASLPPALARQASSVGRGVAVRESVKKLVAIACDLSVEDRTVFIHCGLEGMKAADAAVLAGASAEAVTKRWQRLREKLGANPIWREFDLGEGAALK